MLRRSSEALLIWGSLRVGRGLVTGHPSCAAGSRCRTPASLGERQIAVQVRDRTVWGEWRRLAAYGSVTASSTSPGWSTPGRCEMAKPPHQAPSAESGRGTRTRDFGLPLPERGWSAAPAPSRERTAGITGCHQAWRLSSPRRSGYPRKRQ